MPTVEEEDFHERPNRIGNKLSGLSTNARTLYREVNSWSLNSSQLRSTCKNPPNLKSTFKNADLRLRTSIILYCSYSLVLVHVLTRAAPFAQARSSGESLAPENPGSLLPMYSWGEGLGMRAEVWHGLEGYEITNYPYHLLQHEQAFLFCFQEPANLSPFKRRLLWSAMSFPLPVACVEEDFSKRRSGRSRSGSSPEALSAIPVFQIPVTIAPTRDRIWCGPIDPC